MGNKLSSFLDSWVGKFESQSHSAFRVYGVPLLAVAVAISIDSVLKPVFHRNPFLFFYGAVMVSASYGGFRSGLFSTVLSAVAVDHLISPLYLWDQSPDDLGEIILFVTVGLVSSSLSQTMHSARDRLQTRLRQEATLAELGRKQPDVQRLQSMLEGASRAVANVLKVEYCKILELTPNKEAFLLRAGVGWQPGYLGKPVVSAVDGSQGAFTLRSKQVVILQDIRNETRFTAPPFLTQHQVISGISTSILGDDGLPWGVIGAHSREPHAFTKDDAHFLQTVANLVGVWIQNARKAEELAQSEARFRTLAESLPNICWSATADGALDYISQSWCAFTGLTMQQSLGHNGWKRVLHPDDAEWVLARWQECLSRGTPYEVECRLRSGAGEYRWMLTRGISLHDADGRIQKWFGTCTDVHLQRLAEAALRDAEKLNAASRLAMTAAHEINNPLAAITNLVFLARNGLRAADPRCDTYLEQADRELQRMTHMFNQTLGFYRDSSEPKLTDPAELVEELLFVFKQKINAKQLQVTQEHKSLAPLVVPHGELRQVVAHVLLNAIDASPAHGTIRLRMYSGRSWGNPEKFGLHISITDEGCGIPKQHLPRVFQPFFTTKPDLGTGLGLWTAKGILERHAGSIRFRTSTRPAANGTIFTVFFPEVEGPKAARMGQKAAG